MNAPNANLPANPQMTTIGRLLVEAGKLTEEEVARIIATQREEKLRFGQAALKLGLVTQQDLVRALAKQFDYTCLPASEAAVSGRISAAHAPFSPEAEKLRTLRMQLQLRWFDGTPRALAIASADHGEGASQLAANLAVSFAQLGQRTILVDADLRHGRQHRLLGMPNTIGLADVLAGRAELSDATRPVKALPGLSLLSTGARAPNPLELLARAGFAAALDRLRNAYEVVIIDCAPASQGSDIQAVVRHCGGALIVARQDVSRMRGITELRSLIGDAGAHVIGAVVYQS